MFGDLGRTALSVLHKYMSVKFWLIIVHDNNTRLRSEVRSNTWASEIKHGIKNVSTCLQAKVTSC